MTKQELFASAIDALKAASQGVADHKEAAAPSVIALKTASQAASWAGFDYVVSLPEDERTEAGRDVGAQYADAQGMAEGSRANYVMRGGYLATYALPLIAASAPRMALKGKRKGEVIDPREGTSAFAMALAQHKEVQARAERRAKLTDPLHVARVTQATETVAASQGLTGDELNTLMLADPKGAAGVRSDIEAEVTRLEAQASQRADLVEAFAVILSTMQAGDYERLSAAATMAAQRETVADIESLGDFVAFASVGWREHLTADAAMQQAA